MTDWLMIVTLFTPNPMACWLPLTLTLPGPSAGVSGSLDSYCSLKPLSSGMGEVVPARTSPTLLPHPLALCYHYPVSKCRSASIVVTGTVRVNGIVCMSIHTNLRLRNRNPSGKNKNIKTIKREHFNHQADCPSLCTLCLIWWIASVGTSDIIHDT